MPADVPAAVAARTNANIVVNAEAATVKIPEQNAWLDGTANPNKPNGVDSAGN
ncbi:hypothetical protein [Paraburkholderia sp. BL25I1N1]|uniref:hypothetical protein n=1 Tax=Paraburkholderia sp. BL25I1N1 TaxID=1938804 RepID=UPI000D40D5AA|nr:hypothetical protein [Paraburkholderia sp. BL25I1N1]PRY04691.1 hypothetical protein B0G73_1116 [Paraburkholderia sp. BL25I1N1]